MTNGGDIQAKYNLFAIQTEILVVAIFEFNRLRVRVIILADESDGSTVIVYFFGQQSMH